MTQPTPTQYSRDVAVTAIRDFYVFLTCLPRTRPSDIRDAPVAGWPALGNLGKTAAVNDLIRHLPYIASSGEGNDKIAPETSVIRYNGSATRWSLERGASFRVPVRYLRTWWC